jgi:dienelactone hydrolase
MKLTTRAFLRLLACSVFLVAPLVAQGPFYGYNDFAFQNTTGKGTASLTARVFYPATRTGRGAPLVTRSGGHPVVVCLHGYSALGSYYTLLARHFAYRGYVVVLPNTAQYSGSTQVNDAIALFGALTVANGQTNHFLKGALNLKKVGLTGHSMGGGSTFRVLAANPGFVCGIGIAPVYPGSTIMRRVTVPVGTMHGKGDTVLGWSSHSLRLFSNATGYASLKFFYLFNSSCDHNNLAGFSQTTQASRDVWARSVRILNGFFDRYLKNIPAGLEEAVGTTARSEAKLDTLYVAVRKPEIWFTGVPDIGKVVQPTVLCEPGPALIATSVSTVSIPTSFGLLRLDPATLALVHLGTVGSSRLLAPKFTIPNDSSLRGAKFPLQGLGQDVTRKTVLTGLVTLTIN